ncbi:hypothetical protein [Fibrobacter sp. UWEL]|uniref:hypothetical protein n=1 Tax=Fibrobacter sp. UWEL TaxID=1896209 RepID=UPI0009101EEF|nr:hypothetical protein [Fibrobacter sp. UWEL]SHK87027.1 hypothetical protein SAMN05720468_10885 [Fibrobacter sp. UWEL]
MSMCLNEDVVDALLEKVELCCCDSVGAISVLRALGKTSLVVPDCVALGIYPVSGLFKDFSSKVKNKLKSSLPALDECIDMMDYLIQENAHAMNCGGVQSYVRKRFEEDWHKAHPCTEKNLKAALTFRKKRGEDIPQDWSPILNRHLEIDFNEAGCCESIQSSNYWTEHQARRIDTIARDYNFSELYNVADCFSYREYIRYLAYVPMPIIQFPRLYEFVCGVPQKITRSVDFKFVAKHMDCTGEGFLKVAKSFIKDHLHLSTAAETVNIDMGSLRIENVQYETRDFGDTVREQLKHSLFGNNHYFEEDCDTTYDNVFHQDQSDITFVKFTCTFDATVTAIPDSKTPPLLLDGTEQSQLGMPLTGSANEMLSVLRFVFEHPMQCCVIGDWICPVPTLDVLKKVLYAKHLQECESNFFALLKEINTFGTDREKNLIKPINKSPQMGEYDVFYKGVSMDFFIRDFGTQNSEDILKTERNLFEFSRDAIQLVLPYWNILSSNVRLVEFIHDSIQGDPLNYVDSEVDLVRDVALALIS